MDLLNLNKDKLTNIVIFIFIILSLTYLYNMNTNTKNITKTITENFMVLTEDQDLQANEVQIDNLTQVIFKAGGNNNSTINFPNPQAEWPVSLQDIFDTKLDKSGVIGDIVAGEIPLQGIILNSVDAVPYPLVKIGANIPFGSPTKATTINDKCIQFGDVNNGRDGSSASIFINRGDGFPDNTLCMVGMTTGRDWNTSKISMWATGGLNLYGDTNINGRSATNTGSLNISNGNLTVSNNGSIGGTLTVTGATTLSSLTVNGSLSFLPIGCVIMWGKKGVAIPNGWRICDGGGNPPTPDFSQFRFPLSTSDINSIGNSGGSLKTSFIMTKEQMPNHDHAIPVRDWNCWKQGDCHGETMANSSSSFTENTTTAGGGQPVYIDLDWQPYCHVIFIMRIR